jgi:hypothetical protein
MPPGRLDPVFAWPLTGRITPDRMAGRESMLEPRQLERRSSWKFSKNSLEFTVLMPTSLITGAFSRHGAWFCHACLPEEASSP